MNEQKELFFYLLFVNTIYVVGLYVASSHGDAIAPLMAACGILFNLFIWWRFR